MTDRKKICNALDLFCANWSETDKGIVVGRRRLSFNDAGEIKSIYDYATHKRYTDTGGRVI